MLAARFAIFRYIPIKAILSAEDAICNGFHLGTILRSTEVILIRECIHDDERAIWNNHCYIRTKNSSGITKDIERGSWSSLGCDLSEQGHGSRLGLPAIVQVPQHYLDKSLCNTDSEYHNSEMFKDPHLGDLLVITRFETNDDIIAQTTLH